MAICKIGNNTRETVIQNFQVNNLISAQQSDGVFLVLKPVDFDAANDELSDQLYRDHGLMGLFWSKSGRVARFNNTLSVLADVLAKREKTGNKDFTNGYSEAPVRTQKEETRPLITITPSVRLVTDDMTEETTEIAGANYSFVFSDGATAMGVIEGDMARITDIQAKDKSTGTKVYERVLAELQIFGVSTVSIPLQSTASRKKLARLVENGTLINPRGLTGISVDRHPTKFDINIEQNPLTGKPDENNSIATAELPSIQIPQDYNSPC